MVDWQVTATTIFCDAVDDEVTILVYKDWAVKCTGHDKYTGSRDEQLKLVKKSLELRRTLDCQGLSCDRVVEYKRKLLIEEAAKE
jgi:hypothetical protein